MHLEASYKASITPEPVKTIMPMTEAVSCQIPPACAGMRLDQALVELLPTYSRSRLQQWLKTGDLRVNGQIRRPRDPVVGGETISGRLILDTETVAIAQDIPLSFCYEDAALLVIDKPAGLVAHPAAGNRDGTLVNALLHRCPELALLPRAGLVHRLDKDTTGLLVVARNLSAHTALVAQLQARTIEREYLAVVNGLPVTGGKVDAPVGRHPVDRQRMAVTPGGRLAVTHYRILRRFRAHTLLQVKLETGRTHQIRVHMAHIRLPLLGDPVYGGRLRIPPGASVPCIETIQHFRRQALHAERLALTHPLSGERMEWRVEVPPDLAELLVALAEDAGHTNE